MDPSACYTEMMTAAERFRAMQDAKDVTSDVAAMVEALGHAEECIGRLLDMNDWLVAGGFLPGAWSPRPTGGGSPASSPAVTVLDDDGVRYPSTADFRDVGLPFEAFLRFSQMDAESRTKAAHVFWRDYGAKVEAKRAERRRLEDDSSRSKDESTRGER